MQLSKRVIEHLKGCNPPAIFNFRLENGAIIEIRKTETIEGNILYYGKNKLEVLKLVADGSDNLDWFVFVDKDLKLEIVGEPEESVESVFKKLYRLAGLEKRPDQLKIAKIVYDALENPKTAIIEAPTGTGKSLAYLVPAVLFAKKHSKRIVISTNTKNLQQQLLNKDLPVLKSVIDFNVAVAYGRNNYLCRRKAESLLFGGNVFLFESDLYKTIRDFLLDTETGLKSEFFSREPNIDESVWRMVESNSLSCAHKSCPYYKKDCFFYKARRKLSKADIIIANHHLVLSHSVMENADILPEFDALIVDEAHNIERNATSYYTITVSSNDIINALNMLYSKNKGKEYGLLAPFDDTQLKDSVSTAKESVKQALGGFNFLSEGDEVVVKDDNMEQIIAPISSTIDVLDRLTARLKLFVDKLPDDESVDIKGVLLNLDNFRSVLASFEEAEFSMEQVYWIKKFKSSVHFNITPVNIRDALKNYLLDKLDSVIFTSATLSVNGNFDFFKRAVGIEGGVEFIAKANFNYKNNSRLYWVYDMPMPNDENFITQVSNVLIKIGSALMGTNKGVLVLFTSYGALNASYKLAKDILVKYGFNVLRQGELDNFELLNRFKKGKGFLFATSSFWEGIDVRGEELSVVVIVKLPFEVPTGPVESVRYELLKKEGRNPFLEYSLPKAVLRLKQGLGRLIRQKQDRGVMVVLDSRVVKKSYGRFFVNSLNYMKQEKISKNEIKKRIVDFFGSVSLELCDI